MHPSQKNYQRKGCKTTLIGIERFRFTLCVYNKLFSPTCQSLLLRTIYGCVCTHMYGCVCVCIHTYLYMGMYIFMHMYGNEYMYKYT